MTGFPLFFFLLKRASICRSRIQVEASTRRPHVPLVRFHVTPSSRKGLKSALATAEPKRGEAAFVLRHKARALRQIGEFIVGPFGSARREEAARFAEVSHLFVAPARLER